MRTRAQQRVSMVRDLHHAVERNEFALVYQPIVGLVDDRVIGAEALLRWWHPQRGLVSPADFKTVDMPPATDKVPPVTPWK